MHSLNSILALLLTAGIASGEPYLQHRRKAFRSTGATLVISDDFAYSNGDIGTQSSGVWVVTKGGIAVDSGAVTNTAAGSSIAYHTTAVNANMRAEVTFTVDGVNYGGAAVRVQAAGANAYVAFSDGTDLHLWQISGGTDTVIQSAAHAFATGNRIAIEASGTGTATRLKVQKDVGAGWVDVWTDQNPAVDHDGGKAGVSGYSAEATTKVDTFRAYNL